MSIPLNGRIAIIDDEIEQALPLIRALAQKKYACQYFSGAVNSLPEESNSGSDIRLLFLDINLFGNAKPPDKQIESALINVLGRVISASNFPWVLIYWSRHEGEYDGLVRGIFENPLRDRRPISILSQQKGDYFTLNGDPVPGVDTRIDALFTAISSQLQQEPAYRQLIEWENLIHHSADKTLRDIFSALHVHSNWTDNANYLIDRLGKGYAGKTPLTKTPEGKIRSAFQAMNSVFSDTLEYTVNNALIPEPVDLPVGSDHTKEGIYKVNKKLLLSEDIEILDYSGMAIADSNPSADREYKNLLNNSFNRSKIMEEMGPGPLESKVIDKRCSEMRHGIMDTWKRIYLVVTPLCDFVQQKAINVKYVKGFLIREDFEKYIDNRSEAIFISPKFRYEEATYALVLNFRYFYAGELGNAPGHSAPLFRVRQALLAEIQSKLARHISRQGVLFLEDV